MKIYKIKIDNEFYVKGVLFDTANGELKLKPIATIFEDEAGWFEEDKAIKYCEELNKEFNSEGIKFDLEEVKPNVVHN